MTVPTDWMPAAKMDRIIVHWTAGRHIATDDDRTHYHVLVQGDGALVRGTLPITANAAPIRGAYAAHTLNCNTGSIGVSLCCMLGAIEAPFAAGSAPMTRSQWDAAVLAVADLARRYAISVGPKTILSHAEVQTNLGITQRGKWDIARLAFDPSIVGAKACGDKLRAEVAAALAGEAVPESEPAVKVRPILRRVEERVDDPAVRELQGALNAAGFGPVDVDGWFFDQTAGAVRDFQRARGLLVDGIVGPKTWAAL